MEASKSRQALTIALEAVLEAGSGSRRARATMPPLTAAFHGAHGSTTPRRGGRSLTCGYDAAGVANSGAR